MPCDILFAVTRTVRIIALSMFVVGSVMFFYAIFLRHSSPGKWEFAQTLESFGLLITALALAIGMFTKRRGPGN